MLKIESLIKKYEKSTTEERSYQVRETVERCAFIFMFLGVIHLFNCFIYKYIFDRVSRKCVSSLLSRFMKMLFEQDVKMWTAKSTAADFDFIMMRCIQSLTSNLIGQFFVSLSSFVSCTVLVILLSPPSFPLPIIIPALFVVVSFTTIVTKMLNKTLEKRYREAECLVEDVLKNLEQVTAYGGQEYEVKNYDKSLRGCESYLTLVHGVLSGAPYVFLYAVYMVVTWQGSQVLYSTLGPDVLFIMLFLLQEVIFKAVSFSIFIRHFHEAHRIYSSMFGLIRKQDRQATTPVHRINNLTHIELQNVHMDKQDLSLKIKLRRITAIVGRTKLIRMITGLETLQNGKVLLNGYDLNDFQPDLVMLKFGLVERSSVLFGLTILDGLTLGLTNFSLTDVQAACSQAEVANFIASLPRKFETKLSSDIPDSVVQKLLIARMIMQQRPILVLDNCTSCIDSKDEIKIIKNFLRADDERKVIIVTNKMATLKECDIIVHLTQPEPEMGSYKELMSDKSSKFYKSIRPNEELVLAFDSCCSNDDVQILPNHENDGVRIVEYEPIPTHGVRMGKQSREILTKSSYDLLWLNKKEFGFLVAGGLAASLTGFSFPSYATLFTEYITMFHQQAVHDHVRHQAIFLSYEHFYALAASTCFVATIIETSMICFFNGRLIKKLRKEMFQSLLVKNLNFFKAAENNVRYLCWVLREDARNVVHVNMTQNWFYGMVLYWLSSNLPRLFGPRLTLYCKVTSVLLACTVISFYYSLTFGLIVFSFLPLMFVSYYNAKSTRWSIYERKYSHLHKVQKFILENITTIRILNLQTFFNQQYQNELRILSDFNNVRASIYFGLFSSIPCFVISAILLCGGFIYTYGYLTSHSVIFKVTEVVIISNLFVQNIIEISLRSIDSVGSHVRIKNLLSDESDCRKANISNRRDVMPAGDKVWFKGVTYKNSGSSCCPQLKNFNLNLDDTSRAVGLVGDQCSGHSLPIDILLRFLSPDSGTVYIDGREIFADLSCQALRSTIGLVDGLSTIFTRSVFTNIAYGNVHNALLHIGNDDVIAAAKEAGIHDFIVTLPEGYLTILKPEVLDKMTHGQILRLSLARALLRNPKILLYKNVIYDEYGYVQSAILRCRKEKKIILCSEFPTCVPELVDFVCYVEDGHVVDMGTHEELLLTSRKYKRLMNFYQERKTGK